MVSRLVLFFLFVPVVALAQTGNSGELDFDLYFGPNDPGFEKDESQNIIFNDEKIEENFIDQKLQIEIFELGEFLRGEFAQAVTCPKEKFLEHYDYLYYLSRLMSMSYLFEAVRSYQYRANQIGKKSICQPDWQLVFSQCQPKSSEMKYFLKNTKFALKKLEPIIVPLEESKKSSVNQWINQILKRPKDLTSRRIRQYCKKHNCAFRTPVEVGKVITKICSEDIGLIKSICSEEDNLYGVSNAPELYPLLLRSNAIRIFETPELAAGCLRRFIDSGKKFEWTKPQLTPIFSVLYSEAVFNESRFERGRLFPIGSLREFREKGLTDIFEEFEKEVKQNKVVKKSKPLQKIEFKKIELPKFEKKKKKKSEVVVKKVEENKVEPRKSSFLVASLFREEYGLLNVTVDMNKFRYDYVFTLDQQEKYNPIIEKMSSIAALKKMKKQDKVGSKKAPFPLRFLKFMIDKEMHQNLFNVIQVVGDKFFVKNDIDSGIDKLDYIQVKNDVTTGYQWQLLILEPSTDS